MNLSFSRYVSKLEGTFRRLYRELELPKPQALKKKKETLSSITATPPRATPNRKKETEEKENEAEEEDGNILKSELCKRRRPSTNHFTSGLTNTTALFHSVDSPKRKRTTKATTTTFTPKYSKPKLDEDNDEDAQEPATKKSRVVVGEGPFHTITSPRRPARTPTKGGASVKGRGASSLRNLFLADKGS